MRRKERTVTITSKIFQRPDGRFATELPLPTGGRKSVYGRTAAEVEKKALAILDRCRDGLSPNKPKETLGARLDAYLDGKRNSRTGAPLAWNSRRNYRTNADHLAKEFGKDTRLETLTADRLQRGFNRLSGRFGGEVCHALRKLLRKALEGAVGTAWPRNPATGITLRSLGTPKVKALSAAEARTLVQAIHGHKYEVHLSLMLLCGLRIGEALGLAWEDINLKTGILTVRQQLQDFPGERRLTDPKTEESADDVEYPEVMRGVFRRAELAQKTARLKAGGAWRRTGLVCAGPKGMPPARWTLRFHLRTLCTEHGLPDMTPHQLRDSTATILVELGEHPKVVQSVLRHAKFQTTMDRYVHVAPAMKKRAAQRLDEALG